MHFASKQEYNVNKPKVFETPVITRKLPSFYVLIIWPSRRIVGSSIGHIREGGHEQAFVDELLFHRRRKSE